MPNYCQDLFCVIDAEILYSFFKHHVADLEKIQVVPSDYIDHSIPRLIMTSFNYALLEVCSYCEYDLCISSWVLFNIRHSLKLAHFLIDSLLSAFVGGWVVSLDLFEKLLRHEVNQLALIVFKVDQIIEQFLAVILIVSISNEQQDIRKKLNPIEQYLLPLFLVKFLKKIHSLDPNMMYDKVNDIVILTDPGEYLLLVALFHIAVEATNKYCGLFYESSNHWTGQRVCIIY